MASCGDVATQEALAATAILRERLPDLKVRFVNVVDLFKLQPATEHPHGSSEREFDSLFTRDKPVAHILGCHIEESSTPFLDYVVGTKYQPEEHALDLSHAHLVELNEALKSMNGHPVRYAMRDFTIWPREPR